LSTNSSKKSCIDTFKKNTSTDNVIVKVKEYIKYYNCEYKNDINQAEKIFKKVAQCIQCPLLKGGAKSKKISKDKPKDNPKAKPKDKPKDNPKAKPKECNDFPSKVNDYEPILKHLINTKIMLPLVEKFKDDKDFNQFIKPYISNVNGGKGPKKETLKNSVSRLAKDLEPVSVLTTPIPTTVTINQIYCLLRFLNLSHYLILLDKLKKNTGQRVSGGAKSKTPPKIVDAKKIKNDGDKLLEKNANTLRYYLKIYITNMMKFIKENEK
jgi:hypothetical protein